MKKLKAPLLGIVAASLASALVLSTGAGGASALPRVSPSTESRQITAPSPAETAPQSPADTAVEHSAGGASAMDDYELACAGSIANGVFGTAPWCVIADPDVVLHFGPGHMAASTSFTTPPWQTFRQTIQRINFNGTEADPTIAAPQSKLLFAGMPALVSVENAAAYDTSKIYDMEYMFYGATELKSIDVSKWDTGAVTSMYRAFAGASSIESLDVANWNTSNVVTMSDMFQNARSLKSLDVSGWNVEKVQNTQNMFAGASAIEKLDFSGWTTTNLRDMSKMFNEATALTSVNISTLNTSKVISMSSLFEGAASLKRLDLSGWDTEKVSSMSAMFPPALTLLTLGAKSAVDATALLRGEQEAGGDIAEWTQVRANGLPVRDSSSAIVFTGNDQALMLRSRNSDVSSGTYVTKLEELGELVFKAGEGAGDPFSTVTPLDHSVSLPSAADVASHGWSHPGYVFKGWQAAGAGPLLSVYTFPAGTAAGDLVTLTAAWEVDPAFSGTLTFGAGEGSGPSFAWTKPLIGAITLPTATEVTAKSWGYPGYSFAGWKRDNAGPVLTEFTFPAGSTSGTTASFTAVWTANAVPKGTLTFNAGAGTGAAFDVSALIADTVTLPTAAEVAAKSWTYPGYSFTGWKRDNVGQVLTEFTFPAGSPDGSTAAFTAVWTKNPVPPAPTGTLSFTAGSGTGTAFTWTKELAGQVTLPTAKDVAAKGWKNTGHSFTGWKLDGKGETLKKYTFPSTAKNGAKASFTAVWTKVTVIPQPPVEKKPCTTRNTSPVFLDTPLNHKFYKEIDWMYCMKYTTGIKSPAGLTYEPKSSLTREAMAAFIYRLQSPKNYTAPAVSPFADVNPGDKFYTEITWMHKAGLSTGTRQATGKPLFAPKDGLSREAMAAFIYRLEAPKKYQAPAVSKLADMKKGDKFYTEVSWMYDVKLSTGNKVGAVKEYWPKATLSREAMAAFIYRLVETYRPNK